MLWQLWRAALGAVKDRCQGRRWVGTPVALWPGAAVLYFPQEVILTWASQGPQGAVSRGRHAPCGAAPPSRSTCGKMLGFASPATWTLLFSKWRVGGRQLREASRALGAVLARQDRTFLSRASHFTNVNGWLFENRVRFQTLEINK